MGEGGGVARVCEWCVSAVPHARALVADVRHHKHTWRSQACTPRCSPDRLTDGPDGDDARVWLRVAEVSSEHIHTRSRARTHTYTYTHAATHARTHAHARARIRTHTCTHTHTCSLESGTVTMPVFGSIVQKGKLAAAALPFSTIALNSVDCAGRVVFGLGLSPF